MSATEFDQILRESGSDGLTAAAAELLRLLGGSSGRVGTVPGFDPAETVAKSPPESREIAAAAAEAVAYGESPEASAAKPDGVSEAEARRQREALLRLRAERAEQTVEALRDSTALPAFSRRDAPAEYRALSERLEDLSARRRGMLGERAADSGPEGTFGTGGEFYNSSSRRRPPELEYEDGGDTEAAAQVFRPADSAAAAGMGMDAISEFFRRDARRYDAGF